jgi:hypothetical protein
MDESSPFIRISPTGIAYLAEPPLQDTLPIPLGLRFDALQMYLVLSPPTRLFWQQSLIMLSQGHAVLAASQREELPLVFSSQGATLLGSANLGIAPVKLRSMTGTPSLHDDGHTSDSSSF